MYKKRLDYPIVLILWVHVKRRRVLNFLMKKNSPTSNTIFLDLDLDTENSVFSILKLSFRNRLTEETTDRFIKIQYAHHTVILSEERRRHNWTPRCKNTSFFFSFFFFQQVPFLIRTGKYPIFQRVVIQTNPPDCTRSAVRRCDYSIMLRDPSVSRPNYDVVYVYFTESFDDHRRTDDGWGGGGSSVCPEVKQKRTRDAIIVAEKH